MLIDRPQCDVISLTPPRLILHWANPGGVLSANPRHVINPCISNFLEKERITNCCQFERYPEVTRVMPCSQRGRLSGACGRRDISLAAIGKGPRCLVVQGAISPFSAVISFSACRGQEHHHQIRDRPFVNSPPYHILCDW